MKPNELRIGNLIHVDNHIAKVVSISEMGIATKIFERAIQSTNSGSRSPISLTEEWLIRFGFDLDGHSGLYSKSGFDLEVVHNGVDFFLGEYGSAFLYVEHVHQLQNLYFALTGEELKITKQ